MERLSVDRIEGNYAICEDDNGDMIELPLEKLPKSVQEGDCLVKSGEAYLIDAEETERRREENFRLMQDLFDN